MYYKILYVINNNNNTIYYNTYNIIIYAVVFICL